MAKNKMYKESNSQYMASTGGSKIKNDYSAHANIPQNVIIEDMSYEMGRMLPEYEDTPEAMGKQAMGDRNKLAGNRPKSRY